MTRAALEQRLGRQRAPSPKISAADAGELYRVEPSAGQSGAGHDGQDRRGLSSAPAAHATRHAIETAKESLTEVGLITKPAALRADAAEFFVYENWAGGAAQDSPAPLYLRPMQPRQRTPRRTRREPRPLARSLRDACRSPPDCARHAGRADPQRMQVHLKECD